MKKICNWIENEDGYFDTDCDKVFGIEITTPKYIKFCCFCGNEIKVLRLVNIPHCVSKFRKKTNTKLPKTWGEIK